MIYWEWNFIPRWPLRIFTRFPEQMLAIWRKFWWVFHDIDRFLGDAFGLLSCPFWSSVRLQIHTMHKLLDVRFISKTDTVEINTAVVLQCGVPGEYSMIDCYILPVLEFGSAVWCSAADKHHKLLDCAVSGTCFSTGGVFECDITHRRSAAGLCMMYRIRYNSMHRLWCFNWAVCAGACYTRCCDGTSVYICASWLQNIAVLKDFYSLSLSLSNDLGDPLFDGEGLAGFKSRADAFLFALLLALFLSPAVFPFASLIQWVGIVGQGSSNWKGVNCSFRNLHRHRFLIIILKNNSPMIYPQHAC